MMFGSKRKANGASLYNSFLFFFFITATHFDNDCQVDVGGTT